MQPLAQLIASNREPIIRRWERCVLDDPQVPQANRLPEPVLRDHVPLLLDEFVKVLEAPISTEQEPVEGRSFGQRVLPLQHAWERFAHGYSLHAVLRELSHLRAVLVALWHGHEVFETRGILLIHLALDECMTVAAVEMEKARLGALKQETDRLAMVLELLPVGVLIADEAGAEVAVNQAFRAMWGQQGAGAAASGGAAEVVAFASGTGERLRQEDWGLAVSLRTGAPVTEQELDVLCVDGSRRTILNSSAPLLDPATKRVTGAVGVTVEVTERVATLRALQRESELRERFLGVLGHDLRNPLNTIKMGAVTLLLHELGPAQASFVRKIGRAADLMTRMIGDLLDFTHARTGKIPIDPRPADLTEICDEITDQFRLTNPERRIRFDAQINAEGVWDSDRLAQVFGNLIGNALAYSPPEGEVRLDAQDLGAQVSVTVHNAGAPIPASELPHIFEPFQRATTAGAANRSGLGLGLFISKEIVEGHGGTLSVESSAAAGTTFTVVLPRTPPSPR